MPSLLHSPDAVSDFDQSEEDGPAAGDAESVGSEQAPGSVAELHRRFAGRIYLLALRLTGSPVDADEVTQDTFVRAWRSLPGFRGASSVATWLHAIAVRAAVDHARRRASRQRHLTLEADLPEGQWQRHELSSPDVQQETNVDLERALAELPDGARRALVLHAVEGRSYQEVAELLGVTVGTVKSQVHRARRLLLEILER